MQEMLQDLSDIEGFMQTEMPLAVRKVLETQIKVLKSILGLSHSDLVADPEASEV